MRARSHRYIILGDVDTDTQALGVNVREMMFGLLGILMRHIQTDVVDGMNLHLVIYRTRYDITRRKAQTRVVFCMNSSPFGSLNIPP